MRQADINIMHSLRVLVTMISLQASALLVYAQDPTPAADRLQLADGLYARGMYELAAAEYEALLTDADRFADADVACYRLGECRRHLGDLIAADKAFKRVFEKYPGSAFRHRAGYRRANLFMDKGHLESAIPLYEALLDAGPPPDIAVASHYYLGDAYMRTENSGEALAQFEIVRTQYRDTPFTVYAMLKLASLAAEAGGADSDKKALALYEDALGKSTSDRLSAEAVFQLAELYYGRGNFDRSAKLFARLLKDYPDDQRTAGARLRAAWAAHKAGLFSDALETAEASIKKAKSDMIPDWLYLKANAQRQLSLNDDALLTYDSVLASSGTERLKNASRQEKAQVLYRMSRYSDAAREARAITLTDENRKDVYWLLAEANANSDIHGDAVQYYRLIIEEFPESNIAADAMYRLAFYLQKNASPMEAARYYHQLAAAFPTNELAPRALFAAGFCLDQSRQKADAVKTWTKLIDSYPNDTRIEEAMYRKGMAEVQLERGNDVLETFKSLIQRFPKSRFAPDAHFWRGMLMREGGRAIDAEAELRLALIKNPRVELEREALFHLALVQRKLGKHDVSVSLLQPLLASPQAEKFTPALLQWMAEYQYEKQRYAEAQTAAEALVGSGTNTSKQHVGWSLVGRSRLAQGKHDEAAKAFEAALAQESEGAFAAESSLRLGEIRLKQGNNKEAKAFFEQAASKASNEEMLGIRAHAYMGLARSSKALGEAEAAARYFMSVAILYDDDALVPESLYEAATLFGELGQSEKKRKTAEELISRYPDSEWTRREMKRKTAVNAVSPE
jgi:TolA-binding protein